MGEELSFFVPDSYKEVHKYRLNDLLNFDNEELKTISPSKVIHKEIKLPFKGVGSFLQMGYINIKYMLDVEAGLTFISIIKRSNDKASSALLTLEGRVTEKEDGFNEDILEHP